MHTDINIQSGNSVSERSFLAELKCGSKWLLVGVENTLNFLFSFVVLVAATLIAALLHSHFGEYPLRNFTDACIMLSWMAGGYTLAGGYIHLGLLKRNWVPLWGVTATAVVGLWIGIGANVCWVPLFVLVGGAVAEAIARRTVKEPTQRLSLRQRLPRPLSWFVPSGKFILGIGLPLMVINLIVFTMSGLARQEFQGQPVPDVVFETAEGEPWRLADQRGKVVLLDFWAPWCGPCRAALPEFKALHEKYAHRDDFLMVGASEESSRQQVADFCLEHDVPWQQVFVPGGPSVDGVHPNKLTRPGIPSAWVIDREGVVVGADLRGDAVAETVERLMRDAE